MRFSINHLLFLVAIVALAILSLKFANQVWWQVLSGIGLVLFLGMVVVASAGRGQFALGVTACVITYVAILHLWKANNRDASLELPTDWMLRTVHKAIAAKEPVTLTPAEEHTLSTLDPNLHST